VILEGSINKGDIEHVRTGTYSEIDSLAGEIDPFFRSLNRSWTEKI